MHIRHFTEKRDFLLNGVLCREKDSYRHEKMCQGFNHRFLKIFKVSFKIKLEFEQNLVSNHWLARPLFNPVLVGATQPKV